MEFNDSVVSLETVMAETVQVAETLKVELLSASQKLTRSSYCTHNFERKSRLMANRILIWSLKQSDIFKTNRIPIGIIR